MKVTEIRWHARGGQGAMLAARMLARVAISEGKYAQGMPEFGPERMGAPMCAYNRISGGKFSLYCNVVSPDVVIILDPSLLNTVDVTQGISKDGIIIVNATRTPGEIREHLHLNNNEGVFAVDASGISTATVGRIMPNMPMLGGLVKTTNLVTLRGLMDDIAHTFGEKFSSRVVEANLAALTRGHDEIHGEKYGYEKT